MHFVLTLEKALISNIDKAFFKGDISLAKEVERGNGRFEVQQKGTLQLLEEWLAKFYSPQYPEALPELMKIPKGIRKVRQEPAHELNDDVFDVALFERQRKMIADAYNFVKVLRIVFRKHPKVGPYEVPDYLENQKIWTF